MSNPSQSSDCICGHPDRDHALGPYRQHRMLPDAFGPAYREENMHYRQLQLHQDPQELHAAIFGHAELQSFHLRQVHEFCNKTCAIYYTFPQAVSSATRDARYKLNDQAYAAWFHHGQTSYRRGTFLYKEVDVSSLATVAARNDQDESMAELCNRLGRLVSMHDQVCRAVEKRTNNVTPADKWRDPEPDEELFDEETNTSDHYLSRHDFKVFHSFKRLFLVTDGIDVDLILVVLGRRDGREWNVEEKSADASQTFSWMKASPGIVFEALLREAGLPASAHPGIMHNGC